MIVPELKFPDPIFKLPSHTTNVPPLKSTPLMVVDVPLHQYFVPEDTLVFGFKIPFPPPHKSYV